MNTLTCLISLNRFSGWGWGCLVWSPLDAAQVRGGTVSRPFSGLDQLRHTHIYVSHLYAYVCICIADHLRSRVVLRGVSPTEHLPLHGPRVGLGGFAWDFQRSQVTERVSSAFTVAAPRLNFSTRTFSGRSRSNATPSAGYRL